MAAIICLLASHSSFIGPTQRVRWHAANLGYPVIDAFNSDRRDVTFSKYCRILTVAPTSDDVLYEFSMVKFVYNSYRIAILLDFTPSVAVVNPNSGKLMVELLSETAERVIRALVSPSLFSTTNHTHPRIIVSVLATSSTGSPLQPLALGEVLCPDSVDRICRRLRHQISSIERCVADEMKKMHQLREASVRFEPDDVDQTSSGAKLDTPVSLETILNDGLFALHILPADSLPSIILISDGVSELPQEMGYDSIFMKANRMDVTCSTVHLTGSFQPNCSLGYVPDSDMLRHVAMATGGCFIESTSFSDDDIHRLQKAVFERSSGFNVSIGLHDSSPTKILSLFENKDMVSYLAGPVEGTFTENDVNASGGSSISKMKLVEYDVNVGLSKLLDARIREGFRIIRVMFADSKLHRGIASAKLSLLCRPSVLIEYTIRLRIEQVTEAENASKSSTVSNRVRGVRVRISVIGPDELSRRLRLLSGQGLTTQPIALAHIMTVVGHIQDSDNLFRDLHASAASISQASDSNNAARSSSFRDKMWGALASLPVNIWHIWFHVERMELVLTIDPSRSSHGSHRAEGGKQALRGIAGKLLKLFAKWASSAPSTNFFVIFLDKNGLRRSDNVLDRDGASESFFLLRPSFESVNLLSLNMAFYNTTTECRWNTLVSMKSEIESLSQNSADLSEKCGVYIFSRPFFTLLGGSDARREKEDDPTLPPSLPSSAAALMPMPFFHLFLPGLRVLSTFHYRQRSMSYVHTDVSKQLVIDLLVNSRLKEGFRLILSGSNWILFKEIVLYHDETYNPFNNKGDNKENIGFPCLVQYIIHRSPKSTVISEICMEPQSGYFLLPPAKSKRQHKENHIVVSNVTEVEQSVLGRRPCIMYEPSEHSAVGPRLTSLSNANDSGSLILPAVERHRKKHSGDGVRRVWSTSLFQYICNWYKRCEAHIMSAFYTFDRISLAAEAGNATFLSSKIEFESKQTGNEGKGGGVNVNSSPCVPNFNVSALLCGATQVIEKFSVQEVYIRDTTNMKDNPSLIRSQNDSLVVPDAAPDVPILSSSSPLVTEQSWASPGFEAVQEILRATEKSRKYDRGLRRCQSVPPDFFGRAIDPTMRASYFHAPGGFRREFVLSYRAGSSYIDLDLDELHGKGSRHNSIIKGNRSVDCSSRSHAIAHVPNFIPASTIHEFKKVLSAEMRRARLLGVYSSDTRLRMLLRRSLQKLTDICVPLSPLDWEWAYDEETISHKGNSDYAALLAKEMNRIYSNSDKPELLLKNNSSISAYPQVGGFRPHVGSSVGMSSPLSNDKAKNSTHSVKFEEPVCYAKIVGDHDFLLILLPAVPIGLCQIQSHPMSCTCLADEAGFVSSDLATILSESRQLCFSFPIFMCSRSQVNSLKPDLSILRYFCSPSSNAPGAPVPTDGDNGPVLGESSEPATAPDGNMDAINKFSSLLRHSFQRNRVLGAYSILRDGYNIHLDEFRDAIQVCDHVDVQVDLTNMIITAGEILNHKNFDTIKNLLSFCPRSTVDSRIKNILLSRFDYIDNSDHFYMYRGSHDALHVLSEVVDLGIVSESDSHPLRTVDLPYEQAELKRLGLDADTKMPFFIRVEVYVTRSMREESSDVEGDMESFPGVRSESLPLAESFSKTLANVIENINGTSSNASDEDYSVGITISCYTVLDIDDSLDGLTPSSIIESTIVDLPLVLRLVMMELEANLYDVGVSEMLTNLLEYSVIPSKDDATPSGLTETLISSVSSRMQSMIPSSIVYRCVEMEMVDTKRGPRLFEESLDKFEYLPIRRVGSTFVYIDASTGHPPFWLLLELSGTIVEVRFHTHYADGTVLESQVIQHALSTILEGVNRLCRRVNQLCLLNYLHESRECSPLLVAPDSNDDGAESDEAGSIIGSEAPMAKSGPGGGAVSVAVSVVGDAPAPPDFTHATDAFRRGQFSCPLVHVMSLALHPRLTPAAAMRELLSTAFHPFFVTNRSNMLVYREASGGVFYLRLAASLTSSDGETRIRSCSSDASSIEDKVDRRIDMFHYMRSADKDVDSEAGVSDGSYLLKTVELEVYGVDQPSEEITVQLKRMAEQYLESAVLSVISTLLARNPLYKLRRSDVDFLRPMKRKPVVSILISLPSSIGDTYIYVLYLKQNLLLYLNELHCGDRGRPESFRSQSLSIGGWLPADGVETMMRGADDASSPTFNEHDFSFFYNMRQPPSSVILRGGLMPPSTTPYGTGIACVQLVMVSAGGGALSVFPEPQDNEYLAYDWPTTDIFWGADDDISDDNTTSPFLSEELLDQMARGSASHYFVLQMWTKGDIFEKLLVERLNASCLHAAAEFVLEQSILKTSTTMSTPSLLVESCLNLVEPADVGAVPSLRRIDVESPLPTWAFSDIIKEISRLLTLTNNAWSPQLFYSLEGQSLEAHMAFCSNDCSCARVQRVQSVPVLSGISSEAMTFLLTAGLTTEDSDARPSPSPSPALYLFSVDSAVGTPKTTMESMLHHPYHVDAKLVASRSYFVVLVVSVSGINGFIYNASGTVTNVIHRGLLDIVLWTRWREELLRCILLQKFGYESYPGASGHLVLRAISYLGNDRQHHRFSKTSSSFEFSRANIHKLITESTPDLYASVNNPPISRPSSIRSARPGPMFRPNHLKRGSIAFSDDMIINDDADSDNEKGADVTTLTLSAAQTRDALGTAFIGMSHSSIFCSSRFVRFRSNYNRIDSHERWIKHGDHRHMEVLMHPLTYHGRAYEDRVAMRVIQLESKTEGLNRSPSKTARPPSPRRVLDSLCVPSLEDTMSRSNLVRLCNASRQVLSTRAAVFVTQGNAGAKEPSVLKQLICEYATFLEKKLNMKTVQVTEGDDTCDLTPLQSDSMYLTRTFHHSQLMLEICCTHDFASANLFLLGVDGTTVARRGARGRNVIEAAVRRSFLRQNQQQQYSGLFGEHTVKTFEISISLDLALTAQTYDLTPFVYDFHVTHFNKYLSTTSEEGSPPYDPLEFIGQMDALLESVRSVPTRAQCILNRSEIVPEIVSFSPHESYLLEPNAFIRYLPYLRQYYSRYDLCLLPCNKDNNFVCYTTLMGCHVVFFIEGSSDENDESNVNQLRFSMFVMCSSGQFKDGVDDQQPFCDMLLSAGKSFAAVVVNRVHQDSYRARIWHRLVQGSAQEVILSEDGKNSLSDSDFNRFLTLISRTPIEAIDPRLSDLLNPSIPWATILPGIIRRHGPNVRQILSDPDADVAERIWSVFITSRKEREMMLQLEIKKLTISELEASSSLTPMRVLAIASSAAFVVRVYACRILPRAEYDPNSASGRAVEIAERECITSFVNTFLSLLWLKAI